MRKIVSLLVALCLIISAINIPFIFADGIASKTETFVAEVTNRTSDKITADPTKSNCFDNYRIANKSSSFLSYGHISSIIKIGGANVSANAKETVQTFLFDLNDATVSFTPYIATNTYKARLSVYGSKDGEIWLPLVLNEQPGNNARKGDNAAWNPNSDITETGALTAWSNYNTASMNALLTDNDDKKVYLRFIYIGDGTDNTQAEAKAFGITSTYNSGAAFASTKGVENYISSAGNRSAEGSYWNNTAPENDDSKETYFQKYMLVSQSKYRGNSYVAEIRKDQTGDKLVFKYDLHDNTTSFMPTVWVNAYADANIKIEASKDGKKWYTIVNEDVKGDGVKNGVVYGDTENSAYVDAYASNSSTKKAWKTLNQQSVEAVLSGNTSKTVYLKFSRGEAPASGYAAENFEYRGFGITGLWDKDAEALPLCDTETYIGEAQNRYGIDGADASKLNYFNKYFLAQQSTKFVSITGANWLIKMGGSYTNGLNGSYVFKYDLNDNTISFAPYVATGTYNAKINISASKDGKSWLPLVTNSQLGNNTFFGDPNTFSPNDDVEKVGNVNPWQDYNSKNAYTVLLDNPSKTVYLKFEYVGTGDDEAQIQAFGISSLWNESAEEIPATSGVQNLISNTENRDNYGTTNPNSSNYFQKYLVADESRFHPLSYLIKLYHKTHKVIFKYDLHDSTYTFTPYLWGSGECDSKIRIEASKDGKNWLTLIEGENVTTEHYGDPVNTSHSFATSKNDAVKGWQNLNSNNIKEILKDNPEKIVYLKYTYADAYDTQGLGVKECQIQGVGITGLWDETGYETFVGEAHNRDDISGCGSYHTDDNGRNKENYFNKYLVANKSSYTALNDNLIKIGGNYAKDGYLTFKYDLNNHTTAFYPYLYAGGDYTAKIEVLASKDGKKWLNIVSAQGLSKGDFVGDASSFKPHNDIEKTGDIKAWSDYNIGNMQLVLSNNNEKIVYLKFVYRGTGKDEAQLSAFGISATYDKIPNLDPSVAVGSTNVVILDEIIAKTNNRDGYEGTDTEAADYFNRYLVKEQCSYSDLYHLVKLVKNDKVVVKFDLMDKTTSFVPWLEIGGDKYSSVKVSASKDGKNWLELVKKASAEPGMSYGKDIEWPNFNANNMNTVLKNNDKKIVYLRFEYVGGAYNPETKQNDEETQCQGFGIIGKHNAIAISAAVTAIDKTEYAIQDEELDISGGIISVKYNTGETIDYDFSKADVRGFKPLLPGKQTIYVEKHGIVANYTIVVDSKPIKSVEVTKLPNKLKFEVGDKLTVKGGRITVTFDDDTTDERALVSSMVIGFNSSKITEKLTLTVLVGNARTTYDVTIVQKTIIEKETIRIDATPFVSHDGLFEMLKEEDQLEDHQKLLEQRRQNNCEDDLNLGEIITDSALALTTPTNSAGVVLNVFAKGYFIFEMDLNDRAVDFELTRGWGTYNDMKILASKDGGKNWYLIGRVLDQVSGRNTVFTSSDLSQEEIDKNIEWILTGNPEKKFLIKYVCDAYSGVEGNIQINNIMMDVSYVSGPRLDMDLPTTVPEGYDIPKAYTFGMLPSEKNIEEDDSIITEPSLEPEEEPEIEESVSQKDNASNDKKDNGALITYIIVISISSLVIISSWSLMIFMYIRMRKSRRDIFNKA